MPQLPPFRIPFFSVPSICRLCLIFCIFFAFCPDCPLRQPTLAIGIAIKPAEAETSGAASKVTKCLPARSLSIPLLLSARPHAQAQAHGSENDGQQSSTLHKTTQPKFPRCPTATPKESETMRLLSPPTSSPLLSTTTSRTSRTISPGPLPLVLRLLVTGFLIMSSSRTGLVSAGTFDAVKDAECASLNTICLTSFRWCTRDPQSKKGCSYPDDIDAFFPGSDTVPYAMLYHGSKYDITWKQAKPGVPVLIEWLFSSNLVQAGDHRDDHGGGELEVKWSTNTTGSSYTFDPLAILGTFPTSQAPNMSTWEAIASTHDASNHIRISQPGANGDGAPPSVSLTAPSATIGRATLGGANRSVSDQFLVHSRWTEQFVRNVQAYDATLYGQQQRNWQIGVGAGIGIGVPLLVTLAWFVGHRLGTRAGYDIAAKAARREYVRRDTSS
ncbi:hypothetical protein RB597_005231 [Gaeumannomyces tritici]